MPSTTAEPRTWEAERAELQAVLHSAVFARSPALSHLLSYLCEKTFAGETDQIKEYSVALDVFDRSDAFDQETDSIVRVQANRLRKRLSEYYAAEGAGHAIRLTIPVGQYVPSFQSVAAPDQSTAPVQTTPEVQAPSAWYRGFWVVGGVVIAVAALVFALFLARPKPKPQVNVSSVAQPPAEPSVGLPVGMKFTFLPAPAESISTMRARSGTPTIISTVAMQFRVRCSISGGRRIRLFTAAAGREILRTTFR